MNPHTHEGLTSGEGNLYARSMPDINIADLENEYEAPDEGEGLTAAQGRSRRDRQRAFDQRPQRPRTQVSDAEADRIADAMIIQYTQDTKTPPTEDQVKTFKYMAKNGYRPPWYNPAQNARQGLQMSPRARAEREAQIRREETELRSGRIPDKFVDPQSGEAFPPEIIEQARAEERRIINEGGNPPPIEALLLEAAYGYNPGRRQKGLGGGTEEIKDEYDWTGRQINCAETLAEELMRFEDIPRFKEGPDALMINGEFQPNNFLKWVRHWMMYHHTKSPDSEHNFGHLIGLHRPTGGVSLEQMLNNPTRYFRSRNHKVTHGHNAGQHAVYEGLIEQIEKEIWLFSTSRVFDIKYKSEMGDEAKVASNIGSLYYLSPFTKTVWDGRSSLYHIMTMAENLQDKYFVRETKGEDAEHELRQKPDGKMGRATNLAYLVYYNLADREMLERLLGKDAPLLNAARIRKEIEDLRKNPAAPFPEDQKDTFIDPELVRGLDTSDGLMKFINVFNTQGKPSRVVYIVRKLIQESLIEQAKLQDGDITSEAARSEAAYADTFAYSMARWTGAAARNDTTAVGYDAWTRLQVTDEYRKKLLNPSRIGAYGSPYTIHVLKQLTTDFMTGTNVEHGDLVQGEGGKLELRHKMLLDVLSDMQQQNKENNSKGYDDVASQLVFGDNAMRMFSADHLNRGAAMYGQVSGAEEVHLDKFTQFDLIRGITFDRHGFEEALKEKFFKPIRYAYSTYAGLDLSKMVRTSEGPEKGFKDVHLAEAMFGRDILDIPPLIKKGKEHISKNDPKWSEKIDWDFLATKDGKVALWHRVALTRLAAELYAHRDAHSHDPAYGNMYYESIIRALEAIPAEVMGDETSIQSSKEGMKRAFTKEEIAWLRRKSSTEVWRLMRNQVVKDTFMGLAKGFWQSMGLSLKAMKP
ncbi:MAG TPA: hypothetical protein VG935_01555 [Patescibacteria group bacterium]|nr:hypothetical protein [Patescibacteria group bacterium]